MPVIVCARRRQAAYVLLSERFDWRLVGTRRYSSVGVGEICVDNPLTTPTVRNHKRRREQTMKRVV